MWWFLFVLMGVFYLLLLLYINPVCTLRMSRQTRITFSTTTASLWSFIKMHTLLTVVLHAALCCSASYSHGENIETLMDNVLVLRVPYGVGSQVHVSLNCGEAYENQPVFWKKNGMDLSPPLQGNQVKVLVEEMDGGNYTCHLGPNGEYLNHTVILIQLDPDNRTVILEEKSPEEGHIHCSAPNYSGSFHCTWKKTQSRHNAAVLLVKAERYLENIQCVLDADGSGVHCKDVNCPYEEEHHRISVMLYIYSYSRLEVYTKTFYLREIVRPAKLPHLNISNGKFNWEYPASWERPCTFFGLHFNVKVVPNGHLCNSEDYIVNDTTDIAEYDLKLKTRKYVFCVRAQDKFTRGPWGPWSHCIVTKQHVHC